MFFGESYSSIGLYMEVGQICAALIDAKLVLKNGQKIIRPIIIIISFAILIRLFLS